MLCYNFHHTHRSLRSKLADGAFMHRTPAMVAGLAHAPLTIADILTTQLPGFTPTSRPTHADFGTHRPNGPAPRGRGLAHPGAPCHKPGPIAEEP